MHAKNPDNNGTGDSVTTDARSLIQRVVRDTDDKFGFGTLSCTVYDTAWVALVTKSFDGETKWLFPESFQYLLNSQSDDGSWANDAGSQIDGVLNTAAALLALSRHRAQPLQIQFDAHDLDSRITRATSSLRSRLAGWDVSTTNNVGFELIVPAILHMLEEEDSSLVFEFKGRSTLMELYKAKMARFKPELVYEKRLMTITHSLEAFVNRIDFDRLIHHKVLGSMFASPSSTAVYLMSASIWDDEAEAYLRHAIKGSAGRGSGGVPGVFPTTNFEYTWMLSTLLRAGFLPSELGSEELTKMTDTLTTALEQGNGVIGLAAGIEPDVDDSAKVIMTHSMLGLPVSPERFVEVFEEASHFRVYPGERDPSFSANCNSLAALLRQPEVLLFSTQVAKIAEFLCNRMWHSDDQIQDKWNTSHLYSSLLFVEVLVDLLDLIDQGKLPGVFEKHLLCRVSITLFQACLRPLLDQQTNGSWNKSIEETAYAVLILTEARRLCFFNDIRQPVQVAIERGLAFITSNRDSSCNRVWSDKVSYGSSSITEAYVLAAFKSASSKCQGSVGFSVRSDTLPARIYDRLKLFHQTPLLASLPEWELQASLIEATLFQPLLQNPDLTVLPRQNIGEGIYFQMIPPTWTSCNNRSRTYASASYLYEMMALSFFTYQVDEFMEAVAGPAFNGRLDELRRLVHTVTMEIAGQPSDLKISNSVNGGHLDGSKDTNFVELLSRCTSFIMGNPIVQAASAYDRSALRMELRDFLLAHITQIEDNLKFAEELEQQKALTSAATTYFRWVRTISAEHIAAPFCFAFAACLTGATLTPAKCTQCFPSTTEKYLAAAACRHLGAMCRMYNDAGSWTRDRGEGNLNSIHFPEFGGKLSDESAKKATLLRLAQYERSCWKDALQRLEKEMIDNEDAEVARLGRRRMRLVEFFFDVTDIYGQIYVLRDLSSPI